jgi:hypothetical protein
MKLKKTIAKLEDVEEKYRGLYTKVGDEFVLDKELAEMQGKVDEFRDSNRTYHAQIETMKAELEQLKKIDPEKYQAGMAALDKLSKIDEKKLLDAGKIEEVVALRTQEMRTTYERQLAERNKAYETLEGRFNRLHGDFSRMTVGSEFRRQLQSAGFQLQSGAEDDFESRANRDWTIDDGGKLKLSRELFGDKGTSIEPEEWMSKLVQNAKHLFVKTEGGGAGGNKDPKGGDKPGSKETVVINDPIAFGRQADKIAKGEVRVRASGG